jgi:hypothetical protein
MHSASFIEAPEFRDNADGSFTFIGHAAVFDRLSLDLGGFRERVQRGAFRAVLDQHPDVRLLLNHDPNFVLARTASGTMELSEDPKGLRVYAQIAPVSYANDIRVLMRRGDLSQMSFGFTVQEDEWTNENGQIVRTLKQIGSIADTSIVTYPAYVQTDAAVRSMKTKHLLTLAERLQAGELDATPEERKVIETVLETRINELRNLTEEQSAELQQALANLEERQEERSEERADEELADEQRSDEEQAEQPPMLSALETRKRRLNMHLRG